MCGRHCDRHPIAVHTPCPIKGTAGILIIQEVASSTVANKRGRRTPPPLHTLAPSLPRSLRQRPPPKSCFAVAFPTQQPAHRLLRVLWRRRAEPEAFQRFRSPGGGRLRRAVAVGASCSRGEGDAPEVESAAGRRLEPTHRALNTEGNRKGHPSHRIVRKWCGYGVAERGSRCPAQRAHAPRCCVERYSGTFTLLEQSPYLGGWNHPRGLGFGVDPLGQDAAGSGGRPPSEPGRHVVLGESQLGQE